MAKAARILLVDDHADVRESTAAVLEAARYFVVGVANEEQAMSLLAGDPSFDLLLTDIVLGRRSNGFELAQKAVRLRANLKVLYVTGYAGSLEDLYAAVPGSRMLRKPYRARDLLRELEILLDVEAPAIAVPDHVPQPRSQPKPAILVVEDDARSLAIAVDLFEGLGLKVFSTFNAEDALLLLARHQEISTLFTDIRLPGMTGDQLSVAAWKLRPDLKVVLTSAYTDVPQVPGTRFISKPWSTTDFQLVASVTRH
jgi:CheY-like chemotaxis protein